MTTNKRNYRHKARQSETKSTCFLQGPTLLSILLASKHYPVPCNSESMGICLITIAFLKKGIANCDMQHLFCRVGCQQLVIAVDACISLTLWVVALVILKHCFAISLSTLDKCEQPPRVAPPMMMHNYKRSKWER